MPWQDVITNSTNPIFARRMVYKITEYQKKYKGVDVDSIAAEFANADDATKKEWATYTNNMQSIVKTCRARRRFQASIAEDRAYRDRIAQNNIGKEDSSAYYPKEYPNGYSEDGDQ